MIPDRTTMTKLALAIEENAHDLGWDSLPPVLGVVLHDPRGLMCAPAPVQPVQLSDDLAVGLQKLAGAMRNARLKNEPVPPPPNLAAMWVVYEGWINTNVPAEMDPSRLPDIPGTQECRHMLLLDLSGKLTVVFRTRGRRPRLGRFEADTGGTWDFEPILLALRDLVLEHAVEMAEEDADIVTLASWRSGSYPT